MFSFLYARAPKVTGQEGSQLPGLEGKPATSQKAGQKGRVWDLLGTRKATAPPAATLLEIMHGCTRTCVRGNAATGSTSAAGQNYCQGARPACKALRRRSNPASRYQSKQKLVLPKYTGVKEISSNCSGNNCRRLSLQGQKTPKNLVGNSGRTAGQLAFTKSEHA